MDMSNIGTKINEIISDSEYRKIVLWYDESKEFEDKIDEINLENAELFILEEDNWIYAKYYIESENPKTNFLVYAPFRQPSDEDNFLADIAHYSTLFSANKFDILVRELGVPSELKDVLGLYSNFWDAASRRKSFKSLNIQEFTKTNIELGILTVLSKEKTLNFDYTVRKVIVKHFEDDDSIIESFEKYNILDRFWDFVYQKFGYYEENPTVEKLTVSLILNYTASLFEGTVPKSWERFLIEDKNNPSVFVDNFMNNTNYFEIFNYISSILESKLNIANNIKNNSVDSFIKCDSFRIFDRRIINHYLNVLFETKEKLDFNSILVIREKNHFYKEFEDEYQVVNWGNEFIGLIKEFQREILPDDVNELIDIYANKFVKVDRAYRKFYYHYEKIDDTEPIEDLRQLIENMYSNIFLFEINPKFTSLFNMNDISIIKQWRFYRNFVSNQKAKTAVIISDALRYGCAIELKEELDKNPTWTNKIQPMLSAVPSYTELGMACLLPHKEIKYDKKNVLVDGKSIKYIEDRSNILSEFNQNAAAIKYRDLNDMARSELRSFIKGKDVVYVYHNQIDARGDNYLTENEVFTASQDAINELSKLVALLIDGANLVRIIITADHGYLYKKDKLEESSKVNLDDIFSFYTDKRFLLTHSETDISGTKCFSLDYINNDDVFVTVPVGVDIFKTPGAGLNYVHGGLSLEEVIVPVIEINSKRGGKNQRTVELQLIGTNYKITNYDTMLSFFQSENISKKVLPLEASIYFVDDEENKISNEVIIYADKDSQYAEDRQFKEKFTLKRINYSKNKPYYLIIKDIQTDLEINRFEFMIDIAFQSEFSFI